MASALAARGRDLAHPYGRELSDEFCITHRPRLPLCQNSIYRPSAGSAQH